ncbi:ABC-type sugar transport system permease subunit [Rhizobium tibeticum]|nr:ABC-type sugar transport system permease subunit [Rhizobium tibeticum]
MLQVFGIEGPNWLREETTAMISVIVVQVFKNVGLNMILFLAALQSVPNELYEAARIAASQACACIGRDFHLPAFLEPVP